MKQVSERKKIIEELSTKFINLDEKSKLFIVGYMVGKQEGQQLLDHNKQFLNRR